VSAEGVRGRRLVQCPASYHRKPTPAFPGACNIRVRGDREIASMAVLAESPLTVKLPPVLSVLRALLQGVHRPFRFIFPFIVMSCKIGDRNADNSKDILVPAEAHCAQPA